VVGLQAPSALRLESLQQSGHTGAEVTSLLALSWYYMKLVYHLMVPCTDLWITQLVLFSWLSFQQIVLL